MMGTDALGFHFLDAPMRGKEALAGRAVPVGTMVTGKAQGHGDVSCELEGREGGADRPVLQSWSSRGGTKPWATR